MKLLENSLEDIQEKKALPDPTRPRKDYTKHKAPLSDQAWIQKHLEKEKNCKLDKEMARFLQGKKQQAHDELKLYIDLDLKALKKEWKELTGQKAHGLFETMLSAMLLGDQFLCRKKKELKIRYYCDNLSPERPAIYQMEKQNLAR